MWSRRGCAGEDLPPAKETLSATPSRRDQLLLMECACGNDAVTNARDTRIGPDEFLQRGDRRATSKRDHPWHIPLRPYMLDSEEGVEDWGLRTCTFFGLFSSDLLRASLLSSSRLARTSPKASYSPRPLASSVPSSRPTWDRLSAGMDPEGAVLILLICTPNRD